MKWLLNHKFRCIFDIKVKNRFSFPFISLYAIQKINRCKLFRSEQIWWGSMLYFNEKIPHKFASSSPIVPNAEIICIEFHQLKLKWLLLWCYKLSIHSDLEFIAPITKTVDFYLQKFENFFVIDDLTMKNENTHLNDLLHIYNVTALIKHSTCYQSCNPNCIDHFLTNRKIWFKHCSSFERVLW